MSIQKKHRVEKLIPPNLSSTMTPTIQWTLVKLRHTVRVYSAFDGSMKLIIDSTETRTAMYLVFEGKFVATATITADVPIATAAQSARSWAEEIVDHPVWSAMPDMHDQIMEMYHASPNYMPSGDREIPVPVPPPRYEESESDPE